MIRTAHLRLRSQRLGVDLRLLLLPLVLGVFALTLIRAYGEAVHGNGRDLVGVWVATHAFVHHQPAYPGDPAHPFAYPPSALLLLAPIGTVGLDDVKLPYLALLTALFVLSVWLCLRLFQVSLWSLAGLTLLAAFAASIAVRQTLYLLNVDVLILAGEAAFLVAVARGRWALGGILLGLAVSIKPAVLPLVLVPLLYRQWLAAGLILGVPVVLSAVALSLGVNGGEYVTWTVPYLLHGDTQTSDVQIYNISLPGAVANLGLPHVFATIAQFATVVVVGVLIWMRRRIDGVGDLTLTELSGLLVLATLLAFSFSFDRYALWLLPLFVSITHPSSSARAWVTLVAAYCIGAPDGLLWSRFTPLGDRWQVRLTFGLLFLLGVLAWSISRRFMAHRRTPNLGLAAKPATPVDRAPRVV